MIAGNLDWGGFENNEVTGLQPNAKTQYSFVDKDSISGQALRLANRKQVKFSWHLSTLTSVGAAQTGTRTTARKSGFK